MKKIIFVISLCLLLSACGTTNETDFSSNETINSATKTQSNSVEYIAEYEDTVAELLNAEFENGTIRVYVKYTNNGSDGMYMYESFSVKAFQNDTEIHDCSDINADESSANLIVEVKDGESIECSYVFELSDDSDVEVRICTPTADEELLALQTYTVIDDSEIQEIEYQYNYNTVLYSDEYVEIELLSISSENAIFNITNNSDEIIEINCEYFQLDGIEYNYEDTNYSTPSLVIGSGSTREYQFCDYDLGNEVNFEITNPDCTSFSGVFLFFDENGEGNYIDIPTVAIESN